VSVEIPHRIIAAGDDVRPGPLFLELIAAKQEFLRARHGLPGSVDDLYPIISSIVSEFCSIARAGAIDSTTRFVVSADPSRT
jgi:hypothetical protein